MRTCTRVLATVIGIGGLAGCSTPPSRLNAPPQGYTESPADSQETFTYMVDNAMLADMSIADVHFVPHSTELNSLGLRRLDRCASLLKIYATPLWYDTELSDEDLITQRIGNVKEFLTKAGVDPEKLDVKTGMPGGRGLAAQEAVIARRNTMVQDSTSGKGTAIAAPVASGATTGSK